MKQTKPFFFLVFGVCIGLWFGVNIGKEKPIFSDPFTEVSLEDRIKKTSASLLKKSGDLIEKGGRQLQRSGQALKKKVIE